MKSGTVGKTGFLRLGFEHRGNHTILADLDRRAPYMAQRALYCDQEMPDLACVFLITTTGCLLQGDRLALDITLGPALGRTSPRSRQPRSMPWTPTTRHRRRPSRLPTMPTWNSFPIPVIPHRRARFVSDTRISIAPTATLLFSEIIQPGRKASSSGRMLRRHRDVDIDRRRAPRRPHAVHREAADRAAAICRCGRRA